MTGVSSHLGARFFVHTTLSKQILGTTQTHIQRVLVTLSQKHKVTTPGGKTIRTSSV